MNSYPQIQTCQLNANIYIEDLKSSFEENDTQDNANIFRMERILWILKIMGIVYYIIEITNVYWQHLNEYFICWPVNLLCMYLSKLLCFLANTR